MNIKRIWIRSLKFLKEGLLRKHVSQLVIVRASGHLLDEQRQYPAWELNNSQLKRLLGEGIGGVILFGGNINELTERCKTLRKWSNQSLLLCADIEEGFGQRFEGGTWFVPPIALGRIYAKNPQRFSQLARHGP